MNKIMNGKLKADSFSISDTHTHYAHRQFDNIRKELLENLSNHGIDTVIEAAIGYDSNEKMLELCDQYSFVYAALGVHPMCVEELDEEKFEKLTQRLSHKKVLAVGETGLDYSKRNDESFILLQKKWFIRFIELALHHKMPLVIHCRDAYADLIEIMMNYDFGENPGIIHCFSGNAEHAKKFIEMGFLLGIGGKFLVHVDKTQELREAIRKVPLESIVLETDSPFLKPDGIPGKRNTSLNLRYIVEELAKLKGVEEKTIYEVSWKNSMKFMKNM